MPLYEYQCRACGERFEVIQKFSDPPAETCTKCGKGPVERLLSSPAIQFKGSGWYITDYAKKSTTDSGSTTKSTGEDAKSDSGSADAGKSGTPSAPATKDATPPTTKSS
jgi:putative FmdB family regulatory protein